MRVFHGFVRIFNEFAWPTHVTGTRIVVSIAADVFSSKPREEPVDLKRLDQKRSEHDLPSLKMRRATAVIRRRTLSTTSRGTAVIGRRALSTTSHDVVVCGGVVGSSVALHLRARRPDLRVTVLERDQTYAAASAP